MAHAVNIENKFTQFAETWSPKVIARLNDYEIKVVRLEGEFVWHQHDTTDELFIVIDGYLTIELRHDNVELGAGELFVVPRRVEHCPIVRTGQVKALLIEPTGVVNTANAGGQLTAGYDTSLLS